MSYDFKTTKKNLFAVQFNQSLDLADITTSFRVTGMQVFYSGILVKYFGYHFIHIAIANHLGKYHHLIFIVTDKR